MKKISFYVALLAILISPIITSASTIDLSTGGNYVAGHTYLVDVVVNPQTSKIYTSKVAISFPTDILQVKSFSFANGWIPLSQTGYDSIDNTGGVLIKTAGYPVGLTSPATLGTITLYAQKSGTGNISVTGDSELLDENNQNVFSVAPGIAIAVKSATVTTVATAKKTVPASVSDSSSALTDSSRASVNNSVAVNTVANKVSSQSNVAAVGGTKLLLISSIVSVSWLVWTILALVLLAIISLLIIKANDFRKN